jgi:hypothetical protein
MGCESQARGCSGIDRVGVSHEKVVDCLDRPVIHLDLRISFAGDGSVLHGRENSMLLFSPGNAISRGYRHRTRSALKSECRDKFLAGSERQSSCELSFRGITKSFIFLWIFEAFFVYCCRQQSVSNLLRTARAPGDLMIVPAEEIFAAVAAHAARVECVPPFFRPCLALSEWGVRALPFVS